MKRRNVTSGTQWEETVGYSRAVRIGGRVLVSGTTAVDEQGRVVGERDPYRQALAALKKIEKALNQVGASIEDVVRTRMYVTDISQWREVGRAHGEFFSKVKPAATMVEVSRLIRPELLVEIEVEAVVAEE
ncbi:MAG TPA: RidA family protein [Candidatus Glassbacteria bacterium]|nr:RidA family protein [Candidatus Glassbacteria bacterium]